MLRRTIITQIKTPTRNLSSMRTRLLEKQKMKMDEIIKKQQESTKIIVTELRFIKNEIQLCSMITWFVCLGIMMKPS